MPESNSREFQWDSFAGASPACPPSLAPFTSRNHDPAATAANLGTRATDVIPTPKLTMPPEPLPRPQVPSYEILEELGRGGMGVIYKARQTGLQRLVALKMVLAGAYASREDLTRFHTEAAAVARLRHPNIVQIYEVGQHEGRPYFALEFLDGGSLAQKNAAWAMQHGECQDAVLLRRRHQEMAELLATLARAVHHAHQHGVIHRDLKPSNVLLTADGVPKITDFGLAKLLDAATGPTRTGEIVGSAGYMAPEQAAPASFPAAAGTSQRAAVTPAADIYALGVLFYELLTGRLPFQAETCLDTLLQVLSEEAPSPRRWQPHLPRDLETICLKCLQKEPVQRYATAEVLADDLQRFLAGEPILARPLPWWERWRQQLRRRPALAAAVSTSLVTAVAFGGWGLWRQAVLQADAEQRHQDQAQESRRHLEDAQRQRSRELQQQRQALEQWQRVMAGSQRPAPAQPAASRPSASAQREERRWEEQEAVRRRERDRLLGEERRAAEQRAAAARRREQQQREEQLLAEEETLLEAQRRINRRQLYTIELNLAQASWEGGGVARALELLARQLPQSGQEDLRGSEWHALWRLCQGGTPTLAAHAGGVLTLAFAPDGGTLATAGEDGLIKLWDTSTKQVRAVLSGHGGAVRALAFTPDGRTLASGGDDCTVRLWDLDAGRERTTLRGHVGPVRTLAFARQGTLLATGGGEWDGPGAVKLWDLTNGLERALASETLRAVYGLAFSPDGNTLAGGAWDGTLRIWDLATGQERLFAPGHGGTVTAVALAPDQATLAAAGAELKLWDLATMTPRHRAGIPLDVSTSIAFARDGRLLAVGGWDNQVHLLELPTGRERGVLKGHRNWVQALAFSPDGQTLATASADGTVKLWNLAHP